VALISIVTVEVLVSVPEQVEQAVEAVVAVLVATMFAIAFLVQVTVVEVVEPEVLAEPEVVVAVVLYMEKPAVEQMESLHKFLILEFIGGLAAVADPVAAMEDLAPMQ
jgi:hypothetical protein